YPHASATAELSTLSLHDALPIFERDALAEECAEALAGRAAQVHVNRVRGEPPLTPLLDERIAQHRADRAVRVHDRQLDAHLLARSEEHTSELQSRENLVCRLLLE